MTPRLAQGLPRLFALAVRQLGWLPDQFWGATPEELHTALADPAASGVEPLSLSDFQHLLERERDG